MRRLLLTAVLAVGLVPLLAGCGSSSGGSSGTTTGNSSAAGTKTIAGVKANDHGSKNVEASGSSAVELDDYYFKPTVLQGKPGEKVTLELENEGKVEHTFTIDSQGIDKTLQPGSKAEVAVTIPHSGAVSFYCKFHKSSGMAGALAVAGGTGGMTGTGTTTNSGKGGYGGGY